MSWLAVTALCCVYEAVGITLSVPMLRPSIGVGAPGWQDTTGDNVVRGLCIVVLATIWPIAGGLWALGKLAR